MRPRPTFGINTFLFVSPFTHKSLAWFPRFKAWGFDSVEIALEDPSHIDPVFVRDQLARFELAADSLCACFPPERDLRGSSAQQRTCLRYLRGVLDHAVALGSPLVAGPLYSATGRADAVPPRERQNQWRTVVKNLREACAMAEDRGLCIAMEPLNRFETDFLNTVEQALDLIADVGRPSLKLLLDTFHMNIEEKQPHQAVRRAGKHLAHVHASASDRGTPGRDHVDWKGVAAALRGIGYSGSVTIESFTTDVKVIARAAAIWRRIEPTRDEIAVDGLRFLKSIFP